MRSFVFLAIALHFSSSAFAAATHECGHLDSIGMLIGQTKTFGDNVKVAYVSTEEPAAAPDHVLVFVYDNEMGIYCTAISMSSTGRGFGSVDMSSLKSTGYDSKLGRLLEITVLQPNPDGAGKREVIRFRANALNGQVTLE
ncbi:MAG: hypothetical protein AB7F86_04915 [Bdellovibrionales bacterium]